MSAVSTIDLTKPAPDVLHWLPTAYDLEDLASIRNAHRRPPDGRIRIVSCPTNRSLKATDALEYAVARMQDRGLPVELVVVEGKRWADAIAIKATADVVFDQVAFGYGCNAVEAWGMGIPVIAGAEDPWVLERMRALWGDLPFYEANIDTLGDALEAMVLSADLRAEWAERGLMHAQRYHAEAPALERLAELYGMAIAKWGTETRARLERPVRFRNDGPSKRTVFGEDGEPVVLRPGAEVETDDPRAARLLRGFSARRAGGVSEVVA